MSDHESIFEKELGGKLLASVSRSFYLTLKALPKELREPISLAYLLARTADTIADTAAAPEPLRDTCLVEFDALIHQPDSGRESALATRLSNSFAPHQTDSAERRLMEKFPDALAWLRSMRDPALQAIIDVLEHIISGQRLDIERFPGDSGLRSLQTREELDDYTWRVAGCVGEFWTRLCISELRAAFGPDPALEQRICDGARFGKALQLVNILRDVGKDMALGRCYLPEEDWRKPGMPGPESLRHDSTPLQPAWEHWAGVCAEHLHAGLDYVCRLRHAKLRYATALPLMLAHATLRQLRAVSWEQRLAGLKIPRLEVARLLTETMLANRSEPALRAMAARLKNGSSP